MSDHVPPTEVGGLGLPAGAPGVEGSEVSMEPQSVVSSRPSRRRGTALIAGAAVAVLALVGGGIWAAQNFFSAGPDPAQAIPANALGMVRLNLDPSGSQKIEALRMLNKFPSAKKDMKVDKSEDLRKSIFDMFVEHTDCEQVSFDKEIKPWLGSTLAAAALPKGKDGVEPIGVLAITDQEAAKKGLDQLVQCTAGDIGVATTEDWAVIASSQSVADAAVKAATKSPLADDKAYNKLVDAAGSEGIATLYVAKAASDQLAALSDDSMGADDGFDAGSPMMTRKQLRKMGFTKKEIRQFMRQQRRDLNDPAFKDPEFSDSAPNAFTAGIAKAVTNFDGMAATIRFADAGMEFESAAGMKGDSLYAGATGVEAVSTLPDDTIAAFGMGLNRQWFDVIKAASDSETFDDDVATLSEESGLAWPEDVTTLLGTSFSFSVSKDFVADDPSGQNPPMQGWAFKTKGDAQQVSDVLDKLRAQVRPRDAGNLESEARGDWVVVSPDSSYRSELLAGGKLGETSAYQSVITQDKPSSVLFFNFERASELLTSLGADSKNVAELKPLQALGLQTWQEDGLTHSLMKLTTD